MSGSGEVPDWMLNLKVKRHDSQSKGAIRRDAIYSKPKYDRNIEAKKKMYIHGSVQKKQKLEATDDE